MLKATEKNESIVLWYCGQNYNCWERNKNGEWFLIPQEAEPGKQYTAQEIWRLKGADTNCMVHRREILETVGGWDEQCGWCEDWDFFLRVFLEYPGRIKWTGNILVEYRQVFGSGADGICAEARENVEREIINRRYLLEKWKTHPDFAASETLNKGPKDFLSMRAKVELACSK